MLRALFIFVASFILVVHGKLVNYDFTITRGILTTDGQRKLSWLVNGQSPGPLVEATLGDQIKVAVKNKGNESITIQCVFFTTWFSLVLTSAKLARVRLSQVWSVTTPTNCGLAASSSWARLDKMAFPESLSL